MTKRMRPFGLIISCLLIAVLFFIGCGGGGSDPAPITATPPPSTPSEPTSPVSTQHVPEISNLLYSPQTATQNQGNGTATVTGTINFTDQGGDIASISILTYTSSAKYLSTDKTSIQGKSGVKSGIINISAPFGTATIADYIFEVLITDLSGNSSNKLTGTFSVNAVPSPTPDPPAPPPTPVPTPTPTPTQDPIYEKTLLLRGKWHFEYTIISVFTNNYSLSTMDGSKNSQGGYYIYGQGDIEGPVNACYWPNDGNWTLLDPGTIIHKFFTFYTNGANILGDSCYYQINASTGSWSKCYPLSGIKTSPNPDMAIKEDEFAKILLEEDASAENMTTAPIDDYTRDKYLQLKNAMDQGSASPK